MQTRGRNSIDWDKVRRDYETKPISDRALARDAGCSDTALRKRAEKGKWVKLGNCPTALTPISPPRKPDRNPRERNLEGLTKAVAAASISDLTERGRRLVEALMVELEFLNTHADVLSEIVEDYFSGERDARDRAKLLKALDHETRTKSSAQLANALAKYQDAGPGKKEERQDNAERASSSGLYAAPSAPKLRMQ